MRKKNQLAVVMGSSSDLKIMKPGIDLLHLWKLKVEVKVVSAHRTPDLMQEYAKGAARRGIKLIIAGAGGAAHLPGMLASFCTLPVIGVPIALKTLKGLDSLLSMAQMPQGVPVAVVAIDNSINAALLAIRILALEDASLKKKLRQFEKAQSTKSLKSNRQLKDLLSSGAPRR